MSTSTPPAPAAGWYGDPTNPGLLRYFDGVQWTAHTAAPQMAPPTPMVVPGQLRPPVAPTGAHPDDPVHWLLPTGRTWQSIAAGYLALVTLVAWPLGPITLAMGVWALRESNAGKGHGRGRAVFAVVSGSLGCLATLGVIVDALT